MTDVTDETVIGGLWAELQRAIEPPEGEPPPAEPLGEPAALKLFQEDVRRLGVFGVLTAVSDAPAPAPEVHEELPRKVAERLRAQLDEDAQRSAGEAGGAAAARVGADVPLDGLVKLFHERKGAKSKLILRKLVENTIFEFYDLRDHGFFIDDVGRILDLFKSASGTTDNAQAFLKRLAALSADTAKFMLGLFPEQIALIYKVANHQAERAEIDAAFDMFAPKVIWKRVFAIMKSLLGKEKRFRLALTVWARLRGVAITREHMTKLEGYLAVKDVKDLVRRSLARAAERKALLDFAGAHAAAIGAVEEAY